MITETEIYAPKVPLADDELDQIDLVGLDAIATRLEVKKGTAYMWHYRSGQIDGDSSLKNRIRRIPLPAPRWTVSGIPLWDFGRDIAPWAAVTGRLKNNGQDG